MKSTRESEANELESGVLPTFRLFIGIQLAITALGVTHWLVAPFPLPSAVVTLTVISLLTPGLLFLYLSIPTLRRTFKSMYLPIAIVWAAAVPILDPDMNLIIPYATGNHAPEILAQVVLWRQIILLLVPLVVVSWQYALRQVVLFCALTTVLNIALLSRNMVFQEMFSSSLLGIIFAQTIIFFLVGYMIVKLMKVQREQRQRLTEANERLAQYASTLEQLTISRERNRLARELHDVLAHTLSGDGCGFDPNLPTEAYHYGLLGMRERAEMIGGRLAVESQVGQGTQICFSYEGNQ